MSPAISLNGVTKTFGATQALNDVTISVPAGRVTAILGANGAGKSTAIRLLMGFDSPDSGTVSVLGLNPKTHATEIRSRTGYVPDTPSLYDWMTVAEIGWFAAGFYPTGFQSEFDRLIRRFDLTPGDRIRGLSKGMKAKLSLTLAMAHRPALLVMDEPTSGLDPLIRREFLESMIDVAAEGRTVLLASHQVGEVERVADDVIVLLNGTVAAHESLDALKRSVSEVTISVPFSDQQRESVVPEISGHIVAHVLCGSDHIWLVRDLDAGRLSDLCRRQNLPAPVVRKPTLEETLLIMLRQLRQESRELRQEPKAPEEESSTNRAATF